MIWFIRLDQALHEHPGWTETRLYTQGDNRSGKVPKPMASHFPVGNVPMAHSVGEPHYFTTGKHFHECMNHLFCEDRIVFLLESSLIVYYLCVWKGSIRDETHIEPKILMGLKTYLCDPLTLATCSQKARNERCLRVTKLHTVTYGISPELRSWTKFNLERD